MPRCTVELRTRRRCSVCEVLLFRLGHALEMQPAPKLDDEGLARIDFWGVDDDMRSRVRRALDQCGEYYGVEWREYLEVA